MHRNFFRFMLRRANWYMENPGGPCGQVVPLPGGALSLSGCLAFRERRWECPRSARVFSVSCEPTGDNGGPHPSQQYVHPADAKSIDPNECAVGECHQ